jgi:hypothetical protein
MTRDLARYWIEDLFKMLDYKRVRSIIGIFLVGVLAGVVLVSPAAAQSTVPSQSSPPQSTPMAAKPATDLTPYRNQPPRIAKRAAAIFESVWGIEAPSVKAVESGVMIRFSYRVLDAEKAMPLADKKVDPLLVCMDKGVRLTIPSMEKVGQLRQAPRELETGKSYWMAFSNSGRLVKRGDRVNIVIGNFRAEGLTVE